MGKGKKQRLIIDVYSDGKLIISFESIYDLADIKTVVSGEVQKGKKDKGF